MTDANASELLTLEFAEKGFMGLSKLPFSILPPPGPSSSSSFSETLYEDSNGSCFWRFSIIAYLPGPYASNSSWWIGPYSASPLAGSRYSIDVLLSSLL